MLAFSQQSTDRTVLPLALLAGILAGMLPACAQTTTTGQAELAVAPQEDSTAASDLTSSEQRKRPRETVATLLQGRAPGVEVTVGPNGSISVRIRGASSFYAGSEPLYVVDGIPVTPGPGGALIGISPYDIESIEVLKNPSETALYGVRGGNGVIVIKTKRPGR